MPPCSADGIDDSDFTMDADIATNLLAPIISSQQFIMEELNNQYRCLICKNGFNIVLSQVRFSCHLIIKCTLSLWLPFQMMGSYWYLLWESVWGIDSDCAHWVHYYGIYYDTFVFHSDNMYL